MTRSVDGKVKGEAGEGTEGCRGALQDVRGDVQDVRVDVVLITVNLRDYRSCTLTSASEPGPAAPTPP
jgi:hypothetical protein